ncbi:MAG: tetratricopeptide repeat protein [Candidatus Omnitrophica bacterium]|nr:tetratricopeptide repeat protein [Candidatus Omnitrophota bacterium]
MIETKNKIFFLVVLFFLVFLTYFNSLNNAFMMDDANHFVSNYNTHNIKNLFFAFSSGNGLSEDNVSAHFRPIRSVMQVLYFNAFQYNPLGYHITNCLLFFLLCVFIFFFLFDLLKDYWLAVLSTVLFCIHPINGIFVNYITANVLILQFILMVVSLWLIHRSILTSDKFIKRVSILGAGLLYLISCLCHETAYFLPFYAAGLCLIAHRLSIRQTIKYTVVLFLILGILLLFRAKFSNVGGSILGSYKNMGISPYQWLASVSKAWFWYLGQLLDPKGVVLIWATDVVKQDIWLLISVLLVFILIACLVIFKFIVNDKRIYAVLSVVFIFGIVIAGLASLSFSSFGIVTEPHWFCFNSIGFFVFVAWVLLYLFRRYSKILVGGLILSIIFALITQSIVMNAIWGDEVVYCDFWRNTIATAKFKLIDSFQAAAYFKEKNYSKAQDLFQKAAKVKLSDRWKDLSNLGVLAAKENNLNLAVEYFKKALELSPNQPDILNNLANAYSESGKFEEAVKEFFRAYALGQQNKILAMNLALAYEKNKDFINAQKFYEKASEIEPTDENIKFDIFRMVFLNHEQDKINFWIEKLSKESADKDILVKAGNICAFHKMLMPAFDFYYKALKVDASFVPAYVGIGKLMGHIGNFDEALKAIDQGLKMNPNNSELLDLMKKVKTLKIKN